MSAPRTELELFVSEVERLLNRSFYSRFQKEDVCFSDNPSYDSSPSIEELEAFVLHFRKFLQRNDRVAIWKVRNHFATLNPTPEINAKWQQVQTVFDEMANSTAITDRDLTLRTLFRVRTFGDLSHLDPHYRKIHELLTQSADKEALYCTAPICLDQTLASCGLLVKPS